MPASIAHYQFGQELLSRLDADLLPTVLAFRHEFELGLQGPDIFFFYKPYRRQNRVAAYGVARHDEPAARLFAPMPEAVRGKAALSCLLGMICHYALDKGCHPYVYEKSGDIYTHIRMESAFDRYIMTLSGLTKPRYRYLTDTGPDYEAVASLWQGIDSKTAERCARSERRAIRLLDHRRSLETLEKLAGRPGALTPMTLPALIPDSFSDHVRHLHALYEKALDDCPALIRTAIQALGKKMDDLPGFELNFKGI